jgi:hypothetical protein
MEEYEGTKTNTARGGKKPRVQYQEYDNDERSILRSKLLDYNWEDLGFLNHFWNIVHDEGDLEQYRRMAGSWQHMSRGRTYPQIAQALSILERKARAYVRGDNCRPNLAQMYLIHEKLGQPREGWKWILDCTPKPTNPYPAALQVPERIRDHNDILEFLEQFQPVSPNSEALRFFGLTGDWAKEHRAELFWFLMAFLVGDGGKQYVHNEYRARHYKKTAMTTRMTYKDSNFRVLRYVQLGLELIGIPSRQVKSEDGVVRWNSEASNAITWMMQGSIGLKEGQSTSNYPVDMPWMKNCPKKLIVAFLQGIADSDGSVDKHGYYTSISSIPNTLFFKELFEILGVEAHAYPRAKPQQVRIWLKPALELPFFNPIVRSYRYEQLIQHGIRRKLIP